MSYLQNFKYDLYGDSAHPKLVFLHGLMGSGSNWRKIVNSFKDQFEILTYDQRGHGRSFQPTDSYSPEAYAEDLKKILAELGWEKIWLVGHSMGGRNALAFAEKYPQLLEGLVIEDIGPEGSELAVDKVLRLLDLVPTPFPSKAAAKEFFTKDFPQLIEHHPQRKILGPYFYTNIDEKSDGSADWRFHRDGIVDSLRQGNFKPLWDAVRGLKMPTLWMRGEHSTDLTIEEYQRIQTENPAIKAVEVAQAGHWIHFDQSLEFSRLLADFFFDNKRQSP